MFAPLVRDWMSKDPVVITPATTVYAAHRLMRDRRVRRLPVLDGTRLVGIVTLGDIRAVEPSPATTLSRAEMLTLLDNLPIAEVMVRNVLTVSPQTTIRDAAALMLERKVSGLPVVDGGRVVGIITESDIFRMLVRTMEPAAA